MKNLKCRKYKGFLYKSSDESIHFMVFDEGTLGYKIWGPYFIADAANAIKQGINAHTAYLSEISLNDSLNNSLSITDYHQVILDGGGESVGVDVDVVVTWSLNDRNRTIFDYIKRDLLHLRSQGWCENLLSHHLYMQIHSVTRNKGVKFQVDPNFFSVN